MLTNSDDIFQSNLILLLLFLVFCSKFLLREEDAEDEARVDQRYFNFSGIRVMLAIIFDCTIARFIDTLDEIMCASYKFRRLALRFHPERNAAKGKLPENKAFGVVAEAYEVLADPYTKAVYDQCGEEGLKKGVARDDGCLKPFVYHGDPLKTYRKFFGTENPYADLLDNVANPLPTDNCPETHGVQKKDADVIKSLPLTLTEVFHGGIKKMKIQRFVLTGEHNKEKTALEEKILSIPIMPGIPSGTKIVFPEEGDQGPLKIPADIVFVTEDKPHERFKREGSNLKMQQKLFLADALTGTIISINTIDERTIRVPITSVITPGYVKTIPGEGLPLVEDSKRHGDLLIEFEIEFPVYLSPTSKAYVQQAFDTPLLDSEDDDKEEDEIHDKIEPSHRIVLDGKVYMRADKLSRLCKD